MKKLDDRGPGTGLAANRKRHRGFHPWRIALALAAGTGMISACSGSAGTATAAHAVADAGKAARSPHRVAVTVQPVAAWPMRRSLSELGTVTARRTVVVRTLVDGRLLSMPFREGQLVHAGDLLAQVDPRPFAAALANAQAQLERDDAQLQEARRDLARYRRLVAEDSIPRQQFDTQKALVRQLGGTVRADRAQIRIAQLNLGYARITAPVSGRVGLRQVDPGNVVHPGDATGIVVLTQVQPIDVTFAIPQDDLPAVLQRMRAGQTMPVEAYGRDGSALLARGVLTATDSQIDPTTGTIKLKASFANHDQMLFPGQFVSVRLELETIRDARSIPTAAVQHGAPGAYVYQVLPDDTVAIRTPRFGITDDGRIQVVDGLALGDKVVIEGIDRLRNGAKVEIVNK